MSIYSHSAKTWHERFGRLGFGGASLGNLFTEISDAQAAETVRAAFASGVRYIDTAPFYGYGLSEKRIGDILGGADLGRECVISTKVGRLLQPTAATGGTTERNCFISAEPYEVVYDYSYDGVKRSWTESQQRLQRRRIDVLLAHDLGRMTHGDQHQRHLDDFVNGGYRALQEAKVLGEISAIGIGVNEVDVCVELLGAIDIDLILLAGRYSLLDQSALDCLLPLCEKKGVRLIIGGPYNSGILATGASGNGHFNYGQVPDEIRARVARMEQICRDYQVPLTAAALQFPLAHPQVMTVLPGIANIQELQTAVTGVTTVIPEGLWHDMRREQLIRADAPVGWVPHSPINESENHG